MIYRQCELHRGTSVQVAWIPATFAVVGKILRLRDEHGWVVASIGASASDGYIRNHERDYRTAFASLI